MGNTSATGGALAPNQSSPPLEGQDLYRFIQQWLSGVSGLDGTMFRPTYQAEPPNIPDAGDAWCGFGIARRPSTTFPAILHRSNPPQGPALQEYDELQRHEDLDILCSFYDLGNTGKADFYASQLRDGLFIAQNREPLQVAGWGLIGCGEMLSVPSLLQSRWLYRVDLPVMVRRPIVRQYPVLDVKEADIAVETTDPAGRVITETITIPLPNSG